jgi:hypothetical protein
MLEGQVSGAASACHATSLLKQLLLLWVRLGALDFEKPAQNCR